MSQYEYDCSNAINLTTYEKIIHIIYEEHNTHTREWLDNQKNTFNLGKICVCDACLSIKNSKTIIESFKSYMDSYINTLMSLYFKIWERINNECNVSIRGRVKSEESIALKLFKKSEEKEGKFPIDKCLNDLLGFRIIDPFYDGNIEQLAKYLDSLGVKYGFRVKHLNRINGEYKAYHVYFRGANNNFFPIELQIWDLKNENINLSSHELYKKEYTYWPQEYKELLERGE